MPGDWSPEGNRGLVGDGHPGVQERPALHLDDRVPFGHELLDQVAGGDLRLEDVSAGEDVDRRVSVFGPGVDGEMGFGDDDDSADAEGVELMEDDVDDGRLGPLRRLDQGSLHGLEVVDHVGIAIEQLDEKVSSQGVQSCGPPFSDPVIYRTSPATPAGVAARRKNFSFTPKTCFTVWPAFFDCKKKTPFGGPGGDLPEPPWPAAERPSSLHDTAESLRDTLNEPRSEEHTSELQSRELISYAVFCLKKKNSRLPRWCFVGSETELIYYV